ncbi:peptidoglycan synthetase [Arcobacter aquimarinus]|uniref:Peptidoglycan synthetase n=1 Tax=Arcobacter aquimarinus TaxID=1315211 RepID=A0AAE7B202_9BACT|nr:peptidoglycan synthetase [Arcobacter aquimarinus]MCB9097219.1 peptidoglycan synthetase [Arcobacter sp.]QKE26038.1 hypothetical protein AAQM_1287 [Arcobacter aquimarinus]RXI29150.1 peptidoglycan synthetase [Arcobacter aquimarinus]
MQISSILDIVDGSLLNSPSISFIYSIKTKVNKVKEGDLFITKNLDDIELAIKNGAFAIILEENYPIIDNEIAWIKVNNIDLTIIKLIRFKLSTKNLKAYYCKKSTYDLLKIYTNSFYKNIKLIPNSLDGFFKYLDNIEDNDILISHNETILNKIYPKSIDFDENIKLEKIDNLIEHSLFETTFSYKNIYYSRVKISSLYLENFLKVFTFLNENLDFSKLKSFNNMKAIFLDRNINIVEFGKSDKFIICQNDTSLYEDEIIYINNKFKYAKTLFISNTNIYINDKDILIISNIEELKPLLKNNRFNGIYIIGFNYKEISEYLMRTEKELTLF